MFVFREWLNGEWSVVNGEINYDESISFHDSRFIIHDINDKIKLVEFLSFRFLPNHITVANPRHQWH